MVGESLQNAIHFFNRTHNQPGQKRIIARDLVAFDKLGRVLNHSFDQVQFAGQRTNADLGADLVTKGAGIHVQREASE